MLTTLVTFVFYSVLFYSVSRIMFESRAREVERQDARDRDDLGHLDRDDDRDLDGDTTTLARNRARAAATMREIEHARKVRQVQFAAALVAEATRNRFIIVPALSAVTLLAFVVGGPLPGGCIAAVCAFMAMVPLVARSWLESLADSAVDASGITSDEPVYVPADWH